MEATIYRRPSPFSLAGALVAGGLIAGMLFWLIGLPLGALAIVPLDGQPYRLPWLPWQVDGLWALVAAIAWGSLTCWLTAKLVSEAITRRRIAQPATEWVTVAVAISGYGGMALGTRLAAQVIYAVALGAITLRLLAFDLAGRARPWRWTLSRRARVIIVACALLLAITYSLTHALLVDGSGGTSGGPAVVRVGSPQSLQIGLGSMQLPITIRSLAITGAGSGNARVKAMALTLATPGAIEPFAGLRPVSEAQGAGAIDGSPWLPFTVPANRSLWISLSVSLRDCQRATLDTLNLSYTVLGVPTSASITLSSPLTLICSR